MARAITIVGGGLSGLTLGILLRRRGIPVIIKEAGQYPRHRVCGEFISGRGKDVLHQMGLLDELPFLEAATVRFSVEGARSRVLHLPSPALCVSRYELDALLAQKFASEGGSLETATRWAGSYEEEGLVRATGRRLQHGSDALLGIKAHARNLAMDCGLELHFSRVGYTGICRVAEETANVCGLFKRESVKADCRENPFAAFDVTLGSRLDAAELVPGSFASVAGLGFDLPRWGAAPGFSLGDSISMIPPLTGNGMSLAFESASLAVDSLENFSRGRSPWHETSKAFSQICKRTFNRRLRVSSFLQKLAFSKHAACTFLSCLRTAPGLLPLFFRLTR